MGGNAGACAMCGCQCGMACIWLSRCTHALYDFEGFCLRLALDPAPLHKFMEWLDAAAEIGA